MRVGGVQPQDIPTPYLSKRTLGKAVGGARGLPLAGEFSEFLSLALPILKDPVPVGPLSVLQMSNNDNSY